MDFRVNEDQRALQDGVRAFCKTQIPIEELRELEGKALDGGLWHELGELGIFNLRVPEADGGSGLGMADAVLIFEELGRALVPGPLAWSHLAAGLVEGAATGEVVVGGLDLSESQTGPQLIEHWANLDCLLLLRPDGIERLDPKSLSAEAIAVPLDPLTPVHVVDKLPRGERIADASKAHTMRMEGAALLCGQFLGIAEATLELANDYAKNREQFGRMIGSFQAIKHMLADMFVRQEVARAAAYAAGATLDEPAAGDVVRAVSTGKLLCAEAALKNARGCVQVHGGMGYTWDILAHYYVKRTWVFENMFGTSDEHADCIARLVEEEAS
jgi:alkylation response protein AidB-like acyl-CoA dehydrogenase